MLMNRIAIMLIFICLSFSCKKEKEYQMQLLLSNHSGDSIKVTLYPKKELMPYSVFSYSERDRNVFTDTTFVLSHNAEKSLYVSVYRHQSPFALALDIFDSIKIELPTGLSIKFSPHFVSGYSENLFNANAEWDNSTRDFTECKFLDNQPVESYDYRFMISPDKFVN
jgi:hypothetical protein